MKKILNKILKVILSMPRFLKRTCVMFVDLTFCMMSVWVAYFLRTDQFLSLRDEIFLFPAIVSIILIIPLFTLAGLYNSIFRYSGLTVLSLTTLAVTFYGIIYAGIFTGISFAGVPRTVGILQPLLLLFFVVSSRMIASSWLNDDYSENAEHPSKVLIYGANSIGRQFASALSNDKKIEIIGFFDDEFSLHGRKMDGFKIFSPQEIEKTVLENEVTHVVFSPDSLNGNEKSNIAANLTRLGISVRALPSASEILAGNIKASDLREIDINDLLGRAQVEPNQKLLEKNIKKKVVLVTGAGGSIGGELVRQIISIAPKTLILLENNEFALYRIYEELRTKLDNRNITLVPVLASIRDKKRIDQILTGWNPHTIYHAAAYKHVPLVEHNLIEGLRNNVFGTIELLNSSMEHGVANFVLISSDKAVKPTNAMGASKRIAELVLQASSKNSKTNMSMVRFGNVLGSSGSVVPRFNEQIRGGGPVTITHSEVSRYFMTIPEAAQLVIQASAMSHGGDVFVLDMGEAIKISDLAKQMVYLSGLTVKDAQKPDGDIEIKTIGLRPGEKLYEELFINNIWDRTEHPRIMRANENYIPLGTLKKELSSLQNAMDCANLNDIEALLSKLVDGYKPKKSPQDVAIKS